MLIVSKSGVFLFFLFSFSMVFGDYYFGLSGLAIYQKIILLLFAFWLVLFRGVDFGRALPLMAYFFAVAVSFVGAHFYGWRGDYGLFFISLLSMSTGFIIFSSNPSGYFINKMTKTIMILPFVSLAVGVAYYFISGKPPYLVEFTGAWRLSGALHPAHLAMLCVTAIMGACIWSFRSEAMRMTYIFVLLVVLLMTGARGALIAALVSMIPMYKNLIDKRVFIIVTLFSPLLIGVFGFLYANIMVRNASSGEEAFNTSGRSVAWQYFIDSNADTSVFGKGLGAVTKLTEGVMSNNLSVFVVPHNEYIRFYYDIGYVGTFLLFAGLIIALFSVVYVRSRSTFVLPFLLSFMVYSFVDNTFGTPQYLVCFLIIMMHLSICKVPSRARGMEL